MDSRDLHRGLVELRAAAEQILERNWLGRSTKPAPRLYPHQWSWDSAFIAIGTRHGRWERAALELETLFDAQWANGMVPHIVFSPDVGDTDYFPSPTFWQSRHARSAPDHVDTSGICQPPVHARAVAAVVEASQRTAHAAAGRDLATRLVPRLTAWHDHLHHRRAVGSLLVEVWHPWESGMDNAPTFDGALDVVADEIPLVPPYRRADTSHVDADQRPLDRDYDNYARVVAQLRDHGYEPPALDLAFRVRDVAFSALLVDAELALADLMDAVGLDGAPRRHLAGLLSAAIDPLWDDARGLFVSEDARSGALIERDVVGGLLPLLLPDLPTERRAALTATFHERYAVPVGDGIVARTVPTDDPEFDPARYWRGPVWINICWLLAEGFAVGGDHDTALALRRGIVALVRRCGFHEYFDPDAPRGHGTDGFAWTASLLLDVLSRDDVLAQGRAGPDDER